MTHHKKRNRQRKRKGFALNGWIALDKPYGMTSTQAVNRVKTALNAQKAGHAGTLDPLATGMLAIALGEATKTVPFIMEAQKTYEFTVEWGVQTSSDDREGQAIATSDKRPKQQDIEALLPNFLGTIMQKPPLFSALKIDGVRAYDIAREGGFVDLPEREVQIDALHIISHHEDKTIFKILCGKGTYIRSLARDMGLILGCYGHICALKRCAIGAFEEDMMVQMDDLEKNCAAILSCADQDINSDDEVISFSSISKNKREQLNTLLLDVHSPLKEWPHLIVQDDQARMIKQGHAVLARKVTQYQEGMQTFALYQGQLLAIGRLEKGKMLPSRVFQMI